ncbi:MAG: 3-phosphoshikimate 1-carboxyvinyltransferase [Candidatus Eremiobacteraeota bacterium]|nr:3-phosphoshikimate 1-carboxyvinyltransferase [Candidatus Eremiobacteraeota bacterium]
MRPGVFAQGSLHGTLRVPGDKSISHRALILGAVAPGTSHISGANRGGDVFATLDAVRQLGALVDDEDGTLTVHGGRLRDPATRIDARNSGTTARLLMGLCAGGRITASFDGDESLRRRPMERVAQPLRALGASVETTGGHLPATVRGITEPKGGAFTLELPSAQVKSALLLANLSAREPARIGGDAYSRDHTERMLRRFGRHVNWDGSTVTLYPGTLEAADIRIPGDLSAAAFFIVAALVTPNSEVVVSHVGVNPTRTGLLDVLRAMGADVSLENERSDSDEPVADIRVRSSPLRAIDISGSLVVRAIDEVPVLAVAAAFCRGTTRIRGASELRTKESDRIAALASSLRACHIAVMEYPDGLDIVGGQPKPPATPLQTFGDHRVAMAIAVLAAAAGPMAVDDTSCIDISFPGFVDLWQRHQQTLPVA